MFTIPYLIDTWILKCSPYVLRFMNICVYMCVTKIMYINIHIYICMYRYVYTYIYIYMNIWTHHTCIHIYTETARTIKYICICCVCVMCRPRWPHIETSCDIVCDMASVLCKRYHNVRMHNFLEKSYIKLQDTMLMALFCLCCEILCDSDAGTTNSCTLANLWNYFVNLSKFVTHVTFACWFVWNCQYFTISTQIVQNRTILHLPPGNPRGTPGHPQILQNTQNHTTNNELPQMHTIFAKSTEMLLFYVIST